MAMLFAKTGPEEWLLKTSSIAFLRSDRLQVWRVGLTYRQVESQTSNKTSAALRKLWVFGRTASARNWSCQNLSFIQSSLRHHFSVRSFSMSLRQNRRQFLQAT